MRSVRMVRLIQRFKERLFEFLVIRNDHPIVVLSPVGIWEFGGQLDWFTLVTNFESYRIDRVLCVTFKSQGLRNL